MLKRISFILVAVFTLFAVWWINSVPIFYGYSDKFEIYKTDSASITEIVQVDSIQYRFESNVCGESCLISKTLCDSFDVNDFFSKFNAEISIIEQTEECVSYYGYSKDIKYVKIMDGKPINLHVAVGNEQIKVGSPIIFGSF